MILSNGRFYGVQRVFILHALYKTVVSNVKKMISGLLADFHFPNAVFRKQSIHFESRDAYPKNDPGKIPAMCPGELKKFHWGCISKFLYWDNLFFTGVQCKGYFRRSLKMTGDAELMTGDPHWYNFLPGLSLLAYFFTEGNAGVALWGT